MSETSTFTFVSNSVWDKSKESILSEILEKASSLALIALFCAFYDEIKSFSIVLILCKAARINDIVRLSDSAEFFVEAEACWYEYYTQPNMTGQKQVHGLHTATWQSLHNYGDNIHYITHIAQYSLPQPVHTTRFNWQSIYFATIRKTTVHIDCVGR